MSGRESSERPRRKLLYPGSIGPMEQGQPLAMIAEQMTPSQREKLTEACALGTSVCAAVLAAAVAAAAAALAAAWAVDMAGGGGTRKAKKSNRKRRATRSRSRKE